MFTLISLFLWITPLDLFRFYKLISSTEAHNYLPDSDNDVCLLTLFRTTGLEKLSKGFSKKDPSKAIKLINKPVLENSLRIISMKESWELRVNIIRMEYIFGDEQCGTHFLHSLPSLLNYLPERPII